MITTLLGYYAASNGDSLPTFRDTLSSNLKVSSIPNVCIGPNYLIREIGIEIYVTKYKEGHYFIRQVALVTSN
jgi:hypothetical protein